MLEALCFFDMPLLLYTVLCPCLVVSCFPPIFSVQMNTKKKVRFVSKSDMASGLRFSDRALAKRIFLTLIMEPLQLAGAPSVSWGPFS